MMICPQTKVKCGHLAFCDITGKCMEQEVATMDRVDAEVRGAIQQAESPPKPNMAEIERLVDAMMQAFEDVHTYGAPADIARYKAARAALIAAIRSLTTQDGEQRRSDVAI